MAGVLFTVGMQIVLHWRVVQAGAMEWIPTALKWGSLSVATYFLKAATIYNTAGRHFVSTVKG